VADTLNSVMLQAGAAYEDEIDAELKKLDIENIKEDDIEEMRRKRLEKMKVTHKKNQEYRSKGHGEYNEIYGEPLEREFFQSCKDSKLMVCHFYRPATERCKILDKHLPILARKHLPCKFVKLNIEKSPYLAEKLRIICLPCLSFIKDGKILYSMIGFDDVGGIDDFHTDALEALMMLYGVLDEEDM